MRRTTIEDRAARHFALSDPSRLQIVDELTRSDRAPVELARLVGLESNLVAHHLQVLEAAGLIARSSSSGDGRRRYVHLVREAFADLAPGASLSRGRALFVCRANSARSPLAAALWSATTGEPAESAGTHPADRVHPGAIAAASRAGLDLSTARPTSIEALESLPPLVVTVCDQAHEELVTDDRWLHWSVPDPVPAGTSRAFDDALAELRSRVSALVAEETPA